MQAFINYVHAYELKAIIFYGARKYFVVCFSKLVCLLILKIISFFKSYDLIFSSSFFQWCQVWPREIDQLNYLYWSFISIFETFSCSPPWRFSLYFHVRKSTKFIHRNIPLHCNSNAFFLNVKTCIVFFLSLDIECI